MTLFFCGFATHFAAAAKSGASPDATKPIDILVVGDSQLSFGSGPAFEAFFDNFESRCEATDIPPAERAAIAAMTTGMIGARSTGLTTWVARTQRGRRMLCVRDPDPKGLVNASVWGAMKRNARWVQIGTARGYTYCDAGKSTLANLMDTFRQPPKLVVFHLMATDTYSWSTRKRIEDDLLKLEADLPKQTACLYFTTAPTYRASINKPRVAATQMLREAIKKTGSRCRLVNGLTSKTRADFEANARYFYRHTDGRVRDVYHPTPKAAEAYLNRHANAFCTAIADGIKSVTHATDVYARNLRDTARD